MPSRERVEEFIKAVVEGDHVDAIANFYHEEATMQENLNPPRRGKDVLMEHEASALSRLQKMRTHSVKIYLVDGDYSAVRWTFDATDKSGKTNRLEELALQKWSGDRILTEQFFYDSATAWTEVKSSE